MTDTVENTTIDNAIVTDVAPAHGKNDKRLGDLMRQVTKLGEEASLGKDSLPKLAHAVVRAAADGVITADDAQSVYEKYAAAESKKAIHEHSKGGLKANVSKLRQLIAMGELKAFDAVEVMQAAFDTRTAAVSEDVKVKAAYPFYVDVAREQLKTPDVALTKEQLEHLVEKDAPADKTLEGELTRALKVLEGLITGENKAKLKDDSELTQAAYDALKERVDTFATMRARAKLIKDAAALGINLI